jgi:hypothetical protein
MKQTKNNIKNWGYAFLKKENGFSPPVETFLLPSTTTGKTNISIA